jgi:hypothetical protein
MGDIADMMLEGQMCQGCGVILGDGDGFPDFCQSCKDENACDAHGEIPVKKQKVKCDECNKWVSPIGMQQHKIAKHNQ